MPEHDSVNHPMWYCKGGIEVLDFILAWDLGFLAGNIVKYVVRAPYKGNALQDLQKARFYLDKLITQQTPKGD